MLPEPINAPSIAKGPISQSLQCIIDETGRFTTLLSVEDRHRVRDAFADRLSAVTGDPR